MEYYILRIYRYEKTQPEKLVGVLQSKVSTPPITFTGVEELWNALTHHQGTENESSGSDT